MIVLEIRRPNSVEVEVFSSDKDTISIGRHSSNDIRIDDDAASRYHAEIERIGQNYAVRDLDSRNGLYVNDAPTLEYPLSEGDRIQIGDTLMVFHRQDPLKLRDANQTAVVCIFPPPGEKGPTGPMAVQGAMDMPAPAQMALAAIEAYESGQPEPFAIDIHKHLSLAARLCESIARSDNLSTLLEGVMDILAVTLPFSRGAMLLWDSERRAYVPRISRIRGEEPVGSPKQIPVSMTIVNYCLERKQGICCLDAMNDLRFSAAQSVHDLKLHSVLCVPIIGTDQPLGVIHLDSFPGKKGIEEKDLPAVMLLANAVASAVQTFLTRDDRRRRERRSDQTRVLAAAAHCLRGFLIMTRGQADLLKQAATTGNASLMNEAVGDFLKSQQRLDDMLEGLQDYARGRIRTFVPVSLNELLDNLLDELAPTFEARGIAVNFTPDASVPLGYFDPGILRQVFLNLLTNAMEALEGRDDKKIHIATEYIDECKISVLLQDNGSGMNPDVLDHAMDPFFTTRGEGRAGLGLTYARYFIAMHGGILDCQSEPGYGTTLALTLPLRASPPPVPATRETSLTPWNFSEDV